MPFDGGAYEPEPEPECVVYDGLVVVALATASWTATIAMVWGVWRALVML